MAAVRPLPKAPKELVDALLLHYAPSCVFCEKRHHVPTVGELIKNILASGGEARGTGKEISILHWLAGGELHLKVRRYYLHTWDDGPEYVVRGHAAK